MDLTGFARKRTVRLTTRGRRTGRPRTVKIWFVASVPNRIYVQHASRTPAQWYRNLVHDPEVQLDFGSGPLPARATPITDRTKIQQVLRMIRKKYPFAWVFQLLGWNRQAVAAEIVLEDAET